MCIHAAGYFLYREGVDGRVFLLLRNRKRADWGFPKGHQEPDEDLMATARRECAEETGIEQVEARGPWVRLCYDTQKGRKCVHYRLAETAQEQVRLSREHDQAAWLPAEEVQARLDHDNLISLFREQAC